jgi:Tfp pilus assembly protein PilO
MQYIVQPIAAIIKWSFDNILVPIGELPALINPNNIFIVIIVAGLGYWLYVQRQFDKKAEREGGLK